VLDLLKKSRSLAAMSQTLALVHTTPTICPVFNTLAAKHLPQVRLLHFVDESLLKNTIAAGKLERPTIRRLIHQVESAFSAGADAVMVTCSSIGPATDIAATLFDAPVFRVDAAMAECAVAKARRVGIVATLSTTLQPTAALVRRKAAEVGREIEVVECLCAGAFEAVMAGDTAKHDQMVLTALREKMRDVDAIVLAQASIARVLQSLPPGEISAPVYASPELGIERAREVLAGLGTNGK
jgi:Asp/Glu/hydantoin racemase